MFCQDWPDCSLTVTLAPLCDAFPFHELVMVCPLAKLQVSVQLLSVVLPPFTIVTAAPKPPAHWLVIV